MLLTESRKQPIYLTFDDGPSAAYTMKLLDLLDMYHIRASFFVVGKFAEENPEIIQRMQETGHTIGLHSLEHISAYIQPPGYPKKDFSRSVKILKQLGINPRFYRPPWGHTRSCTRKLAKQYGLEIIYWDVMAEDWKGNTSAEEIAEKLLTRTRPGHIVCLHDGRGKKGAPERTINALKTVLPLWIKKGYQFHTIGEGGLPCISPITKKL